MSAVFGILNINERPAAIEKLQQMRSAMSCWGPDGNYLWHEGPAALGQLQLYNTPESVNERFPMIDQDRGLVFISSARIDNRQELFHLLNIPNEKKLTITDAELMFNAYLKWDKKCVHHLLGDWCFAVWNKKIKELFIARDPFGISGLYYYSGNGQFIFSTSLKGILILPEVPKKLNEFRLSQILVSWPGEGIQTCYDNIIRLPPAHNLTISNGRIVKNKYYFLENIKELKLLSDNDYIDAFNEIFSASVQCRLRSIRKTGSTLSSGLDSSSVSVVAATLLKDQGVSLPVFTSVPKHECIQPHSSKRIFNEGPLASKVVKHNGNMDHYLLNSENISILEGIKKSLQNHDQPVHAAANSYWITDIMSKAKEIDCSALLTGQCGNATISWPTPSYFNLYNSPKLPVINFKNLTHWHSFKTKIVKPVLPEYFRTLIKNIQSGTRPWEKYSAIHPQLAKTMNLYGKMKEAGFDPTFSPIFESHQSRLQIIKPGETIVGHSWLETGAAYGIEVRDPTMDIRVIEFCLSVPDRVYISEKKDRMLIRSAMQDLLPDEVLWNNCRGLQGADLSFRIEDDLKEWQYLVDSFFKNKKISELLDCYKIKKVLGSITEIKMFNQVVSVLTRGCMAGIWLNDNEYLK
jgi:asparagine synthase (glutamine-hydrolysing)